MTDKELADRCVALGVGETGPAPTFVPGKDTGVFAFAFVRDPRMAMALMERCHDVDSWHLVDPFEWEVTVRRGEREPIYIAASDSLPRAIIEACVLALEGK